MVAGVWRRFYAAIAGVLDLKARWKLGVDTHDFAGSRDGVLTNGATFTTIAGKDCVNLGDGRCVTLPEITLGNKPWTFSLWYYPRSFKTYSHLLTSSIVQGTFTLKLSISGSAGTPYFHTSTVGSQMANAAIPIGQWSMLTFTYDGTTARIYIGTTLVKEIAVNFNIPTTGFIIGAGANVEYSDGYQRETLYFDRALTIEEIGKLYNKLV
jgi:hypothetical protein